MAAVLLSAPRIQLIDANGPVVGAKLYTYATGTSTQISSYTSPALTTQHPNPAISNDKGYFAPIWLDPDLGAVKVKFYDSNDVDLQLDIDPYQVDTFDQDDLAAILFPLTASEAAAGITSSAINPAYTEGDIRRYKAAGGSSDDTTAFLNAIKQNANGGAEIRLAPGVVYTLSSWSAYTPTGPIKISGANGATIKAPASSTFLAPSTDFAFSGVVFDGWASVARRPITDTGSFTNVEVDGCVVKNSTGVAFDIERPIECYRFTRNIFRDNAGGYCIKVGENTYANQDTYQKGILRDNFFLNTTATGSASCAAALIYGHEVDINGNFVDGVLGDSGEGWGFYTKVRFGFITNNSIRNVSSTSSGDIVGINVKGSPRALTTAPQGYNVIVTGNHIYNCGVLGTKGGGIRAQTDDVLLANNEVEDCGIGGITADDSNGSHNIQISNNRIYASVSTGVYGIRMDCKGDRIRCFGNIVDGPIICINVSPAGASTDFEIFDNTLKTDASSGVAILFSQNADISNFKIRNNTVVAANVGIQNDGGSGTITGMRVIENDLARATTKVSGSFPSNTVVRGNTGYVTENGGQTAAIATGATVTHGLSVAPRTVVVSAADAGPTDVYITSAGATTFVINYGGGGAHSFNWEAKSASYYGG